MDHDGWDCAVNKSHGTLVNESCVTSMKDYGVAEQGISKYCHISDGIEQQQWNWILELGFDKRILQIYWFIDKNSNSDGQNTIFTHSLILS